MVKTFSNGCSNALIKQLQINNNKFEYAEWNEPLVSDKSINRVHMCIDMY